MTLNCIIIDDEPLALGLMESYVKRTQFLNLVGKYSSAVHAMEEMPGKNINLVFVDIQMPELNGLDFSRNIDKHTKIIFTTAFDQYAIDGYKVNALDYLLKPISYIDFLQAANKAMQWFEEIRNHEQQNIEPDYIFVKSDYKLIRIDLKSILYIEGLKDYIKIYTKDEQKPVISLMSLKSMEEQLPKSHFIRIHRSFIVNKKEIKVIDRGRIVFEKTYIPIGESYKQVLQSFLNNNTI